jgi:hypothetical protein
VALFLALEDSCVIWITTSAGVWLDSHAAALVFACFDDKLHFLPLLLKNQLDEWFVDGRITEFKVAEANCPEKPQSLSGEIF